MKNPLKSIWNFRFNRLLNFFRTLFGLPRKYKVKMNYIQRDKNLPPLITVDIEKPDETFDTYFKEPSTPLSFTMRKLTKNQFRQLALSHGYEARYSGREKFFYLHKTISNY